MKKTYPFSDKAPTLTAPAAAKNRSVPVFLLVIVALLSSLSSCQRSPHANFSPTVHPTYRPLTLSTPTPRPIPDSLLTASLGNAPLVLTAPVQSEKIVTVARPGKVNASTGGRQAVRRHLLRRLLTPITTPPQCDQIVLRSGDVIDAKVKEVGRE